MTFKPAVPWAVYEFPGCDVCGRAESHDPERFRQLKKEMPEVPDWVIVESEHE